MRCLFLLCCLASACRTPTPAAPRPFHDWERGVHFDPPEAPYVIRASASPYSIAHYADPKTRAGIHVLMFPSSGPTQGKALDARIVSYLRGLRESVAGLAVIEVRPLRRFGLEGREIEYEGGSAEKARTFEWVLYAPGRVYVVKVAAPAARFSALAAPLLAARDTLRIEGVP